MAGKVQNSHFLITYMYTHTYVIKKYIYIYIV